MSDPTSENFAADPARHAEVPVSAGGATESGRRFDVGTDGPEEPFSAGSEADPAEQVQSELIRFRDLALRAQADFDNYRKRAAREKEEATRYANSSLLERLLPIIDNFDLGMSAARQAQQSAPETASGLSALLNGMSMVQKQFDDFLRDQGVQPIDAVGQPFDPYLHEAMGQEPSSEVPEGHVVRQLRRGYRLRERLLRPANVFVAKAPAPPAETSAEPPVGGAAA